MLILVFFLFVILAGIYVFLAFYNKKIKLLRQNFIQETMSLNPVVYNDIQTSYQTIQKYNTTFSVANRCDIYFFDDFLVLFRTQHFFFRILFPPIVITSNINIGKNIFGKQADNPMADILVSTMFQNNFETFKPTKIRVLKSAVEITLPDRNDLNTKKCITLNWITKEQTTQLERIKNWC